MKIWLDDVRPAPPGWFWVKEAETLISFLAYGVHLVDHISLDHDLGEDCLTGMAVVDFLLDVHNDGSLTVDVHSANIPAAERMDRELRLWRYPGNRVWVNG